MATNTKASPQAKIDPSGGSILPIFAATIFTSATILFLVQPMVGKILLPYLGGTPAVWNTCMVFFQGLLLAGYSYSHLSTSRLSPRTQVKLHMAVLALALVVLFLLRFDIEPLAQSILPPPTDKNPIPWLLSVLMLAAGLPFFAVSTSAPLIQSWFSKTPHPQANDPYFLYAASNLGSMLALVGYPFVVEPNLTLEAQRWVWLAGFALLSCLTITCGYRMLRYCDQDSAETRSPNQLSAAEVIEPLNWGERLRWVMLAAVPSSLMLGATTYMTTDIAAIPLLWIPPLALYLLSFILVFSRLPASLLSVFNLLLPLTAMLLIFMLVTGIKPHNILYSIGIHLGVLFVAAMACHGLLARERPAPAHLTEFYLWMSAGGVLGGIFNGLIAPLAFYGLAEYPIALLAACALCSATGGQVTETASTRRAEWGLAALSLAGSLILFWLRSMDVDIPNYSIWSEYYLFGAVVAGILAWLISAYLANQIQFSTMMDLMLPLCIGVLVLALLNGTYSDMLFNSLKTKVADRLGLSFSQVQAILALGVPLIICFTFVDRPFRLALGAGAVMLACTLDKSHDSGMVTQRRGFFGVLQVENRREDGMVARRLEHGTTLHGMQFIESGWIDEPLTYYHRSGPIGQIVKNCFGRKVLEKGPDGKERDKLPHIGVIGLGTGSMAAYAQPDQQMTFFDIDPMVRSFSFDGNNPYFWYVTNAKNRGAKLDIRMGDARIRMSQEPAESYDLIVVDAFSSDAIPVHLITLEALQIYIKKLTPNGIVAFHVSNRYLDLVPVLANLAEKEGLEIRYNSDNRENWSGKTASSWVALSKSKEAMEPLDSEKMLPNMVNEIHMGLLALPSFASLTPGTGRGLAYSQDALRNQVAKEDKIKEELSKLEKPETITPEFKAKENAIVDRRVQELLKSTDPEDIRLMALVQSKFMENPDVLAQPAGGFSAMALLLNGMIKNTKAPSPWIVPEPKKSVGLWTDDYSNLLATWNR
jgi:spermidine synthase